MKHKLQEVFDVFDKILVVQFENNMGQFQLDRQLVYIYIFEELVEFVLQ